jgi:uncharacterized protein YndB with AHSA1/START domain
MENKIIIIEQILNASPNNIWKALTDKYEMKKWYFNLESFNPVVGFRFSFTGGPSPERQYVHQCEIKEVINEKKLTYSWSYQGYTGTSLVSFELFPRDGKTLLTLTHEGIVSFPDEQPDFAIHNFEEGWNHIIHTSLKQYLESND